MRHRQRTDESEGDPPVETDTGQRRLRAKRASGTAEAAADSISKSAMKRRAIALQEVGEALVELSPERLGRLDLPEDLRVAVREAQGITAHGGRKRQMQYIGRVMRDVDAEPIIAQLEALRAPDRQEVARQHMAERWRDALLSAEGLETEVTRIVHEVGESGEVSAEALARLVTRARHERAHGQPPRAYRQLYQVLRQAIDLQVKREAAADTRRGN